MKITVTHTLPLLLVFSLGGCDAFSATDLAPDEDSAPPENLPMATCLIDPDAIASEHELPAETRAQIESARAAVAPLSTVEAAEAAGYRLFAGTTPTMGQHWVNPRISAARVFDPERPSILMFAPVGGEERLVGVSYSLRQEEGDPLPEGFHGDYDVWHTHETQRGDGHVAMVHLWFAPALEGPFTDHNPYLAFEMAGLPTPPADRFAAPEGAERMRHLALALGEAHVPFPNIEVAQERMPALAQALDPYRAEIRALVPALGAAQDRDDWSAYADLADEAIAHWADLREAFVGAVPERAAEGYLGASARAAGCGGHGDGHDGDHGDGHHG